MSIFSQHFPLGLGTTRFPINGPQDTAGIDSAVRVAVRAIERGVDFIDVGYTYSGGQAMTVLREAFRQAAKPVSVTAKVMYGLDKTADDARRRVESYLASLGLERIQYFTCWTVWNYETFEKLMEKGGIYEGALRLKEEGLVDHICASLHAPPEDILKILDSGAFEGITVSYSPLNASRMLPVLDAARAKGTGVAVMNPLGGGLIAQNRDYFSFLCGPEDQGNTVHAALRFAKAHPAVDIVLGGVSRTEELEDSLGVFGAPDPEPPDKRAERVLSGITELRSFCTGCKYCAGCPKGIPTAEIMQARNALLFAPVPAYNRTGPEELLYNLQLFRRLLHDESWFPETAENPCVRCGQCEGSCTQKLGIMDAVADTYRRAEKAYFSRSAHRERLAELLNGKGYRRVGIYPNGGFANYIMRLYRASFGEPEFEWVQFNSDPKMLGQLSDGLPIHVPSEIPELDLDILLVITYKYAKDIMESLRPYERQGLRLAALHRDTEMPWVF